MQKVNAAMLKLSVLTRVNFLTAWISLELGQLKEYPLLSLSNKTIALKPLAPQLVRLLKSMII